jgi:hypothetical protein
LDFILFVINLTIITVFRLEGGGVFDLDGHMADAVFFLEEAVSGG